MSFQWGGYGLQIRNISIVVAVIITLYFLVQSFASTSHATSFTPSSWQRRPRIIKVTQRLQEQNYLYQGSLRSHEKHDRLHGYGMNVLRDDTVVDNYYSRPTYMLKILMDELLEPAEQRAEWLVWFSPDVVLMNPQIPLEIFLPPDDFPSAHVLGTHDAVGFNGGVFFLRVHEWSVRMLIEVLSYPKSTDAIKTSPNPGDKAFEMVLKAKEWNKHVFYQPRKWYNAYHKESGFEGELGDLAVHFHHLGGDKWRAMAETLDELKVRNSWNIALERTGYEKEIEDYWNRIREASDLLPKAETRMDEEAVQNAVRRMQYATDFEADKDEIMKKAIGILEKALGVQDEV